MMAVKRQDDNGGQAGGSCRLSLPKAVGVEKKNRRLNRACGRKPVSGRPCGEPFSLAAFSVHSQRLWS
jgi:hypothetical protein